MSKHGFIRVLLLCCLLLSVACGRQQKDSMLLDDQAIEVAKANMRLGSAYMEDGQYERALQRMEYAREVAPREPGIYNMLGVLYQRIGEMDHAEKNFLKAIDLDPENSSSLNNYGQMLCQTGREEKADAMFVRAASNPLYANPEIAWINAGLCAQKAGRLEVAEAHYRRALEIGPELSRPLIRLAEVRNRQGQPLSALAFLQRYHQVQDYSAFSLKLGMDIQRQLGNEREVENYRFQLRERFPEAVETERRSDASDG